MKNMTDDEKFLDECEKWANAATPGPWVHHGSHGMCVSSGEQMVADMTPNASWSNRTAPAIGTAVFIAQSREAIPRLIAMVRERDARIAKLEHERPNDGRSGRCGIRISGDEWCVRDVGHEGDHR